MDLFQRILRFQKRIRIFKGLTLNLSKTGTSWTLGGPGASVNVRGGKVTGTVGVPGTGLSYRETLSEGSQSPQAEEPYRPKPWRGVLWMLLIGLVLYLAFR